jgi:hypothetical protein
MLTLRRFRAMADSYGADLRRWPEEVREEARALLNASPEARALLGAAQALDDVIEGASRHETAARRERGGPDAALARLRSRVAARIAASADLRSGWALPQAPGAAPSRRLRWAGIAAGSGLAIVAGLLIGALSAPAPASDTLLPMLQPAPIHFLAD